MDTRLIEPFYKSAGEIIKQIADIDILKISGPEVSDGEIASYGVSSIISFTGKIKGRLIIDFEPPLAQKILENMTGEAFDDLKNRMFLAGISEINNIIAGDANTHLNNSFTLGLRLAPPVVFTGKNLVVAASKMNSASIECNSDFGRVRLNIGFEGALE